MKRLYVGGPILPMEDSIYAEALLVENGKISACGKLEDLEPLAAGAERVDLQGRTLMPAFIDGHSHITALAQTMGLCQLGGASSLEEIGGRIRKFRMEQNLAPGQWIIGFGYDQNLLPGKLHPTAADLDRISPDHPVMIGHASGHMGAVNTLALKALGIMADTPDPEGGRIGRLPGSREPSGYLEETAFTTLGAQIPSDPASAMENVKRAERVYLQNGITTIHDGLTKAPEWKLLQAMAGEGRFDADVVSYIDIRDNASLLAEHPQFKNYVNHLRIGGYKLFLDGSPQGRTAWMTEPYLGGEPDYRGYPIYTDSQAEAYLEQAQRENVQIAVHCNGDAAAQQMIDCYRKACKRHGNRIRPLMIHAQLLRPDQLPAMKELGMIASFFAAHVYHWGDVHIQNFGMARASRISPACSALECGVPFDFHQDTPVIPPNMLETVWCAVERTTQKGVTLGPEQRLTPYQALRAVTADAAYAIFEEREKGTLSPGKRTDLILLDRDPLTCPPREIKQIRVLETIKDGRTVCTAG